MNSEIIHDGWHTDSWSAEKEAALIHFGYPADWASDTCSHVAYWKNAGNNVFDRLAKMDVLVPHMDKTKRVRVRFEYDPDYPIALFIVEGLNI